MGKRVVQSDRAEQKRQQILETALKVFGKEGYADTDVQVVADLAKVGKGTIYRHFGNKRELFLATARYSVERLGQFIRQQVDERAPAPQVLRDVALAYARYYELFPEAVEIMIQERATFREQVYPTHLLYRAETRNEFEEFLRQSMQRGELRQVDLQQATNAYADLLYGSVVNGCLEGAKGSLLHRVEQAFDIFLKGLLAPSTAQVQ
jgi:AcrR family transcriptional regulator